MASEGPEGPLWCVAQGARLGGAPVIDWGVSGVEFRGCAVVDWQQLVGLIWQNLLDIGKPHACSEQSCQTHAKKKNLFFFYILHWSLVAARALPLIPTNTCSIFVCPNKGMAAGLLLFFCCFLGGVFSTCRCWSFWSLCGLYDRYVGCMNAIWNSAESWTWE